MKIRQLLIGAGIVWVLLAIYYFHAQAWSGFPDGALTELGRVRKKIYPLLSALCAAAALGSWGLASRTSGSARAAKAALVALPSASLLLWALDRYLIATLDDGRGG